MRKLAADGVLMLCMILAASLAVFGQGAGTGFIQGSVSDPTGAVIVGAAPFFSLRRPQLAELAIRYRMPSIFGNRAYVEAGGLMSYGQKIADNYRRAASYVDKIFKGAKPGDLPVEQPITLELVINLKTANALGLTIPQTLLLRADEVIQ